MAWFPTWLCMAPTGDDRTDALDRCPPIEVDRTFLSESDARLCMAWFSSV
ncbi:MAG: hypothetical protein V5A28_13245 [Haloarculaceae archaeon]